MSNNSSLDFTPCETAYVYNLEYEQLENRGKIEEEYLESIARNKDSFFLFFLSTRKLLEVPFKASAFNFIPISLKLIKLANEDFDESENERLLSSQLKIYIYTLIIIRKTRKGINLFLQIFQ